MCEQIRKIGIVSLYHRSRNFGGLLQAYALPVYLCGQGYDAEQICYLESWDKAPPLMARVQRLTVKKVVRKLWWKTVNGILKKGFQRQAAAMYAFGQHVVSHSKEVYTENTIQSCREYDAYITGSDQVWNLNWYEPVFFLKFVEAGKPRIAYAASLGRRKLTEEEAERYREELKDFSAVSLREEDAVELLSPLSPVPVEWVVDPTLLLTREQWDEVCADRIVREPYVFCYFLGESRTSRKLALEFGRKRNLKVISIRYPLGCFRTCDMGFGDKRLCGISPSGFLSLIKHANYVLTDSFHAVVFSEIFGKEYAVFRRGGKDAMTSRIYSITNLFESPERYCDSDEKETLAYLESLSPADPKRPLPALETLRKRSCEFLMENLTCQEQPTPCETPPTESPEK